MSSLGHEHSKPRLPCAASFDGPGPCYALPGLVGTERHDPSSRHVKAPAYHMGVRPERYSDKRSDGPGPCYLPPPKVYYRGKESVPASIIMNGRQDRRADHSPGPADYGTCRSDVVSYHRRQPAFSMSHASRVDATRRSTSADTPAPNSYNPDAMLGSTVRSSKPRAPRFTIASRSDYGGYLSSVPSGDLVTPGPGHYKTTRTETFKNRSPGFTIAGRYCDDGCGRSVPGPADHSPTKISATKSKTPAFSFGIRHSKYVVLRPREPVS